MGPTLSRARVLRSLALAVAGSSVGAACGPLRPGTEGVAPGSSRTGTFTAYLVTNDPVEGPRFFNETVFPRFAQQFPGIKIDPVMDVFGPLLNKVAVTLAAGTGPDLWHTDDVNGPGYAAQGWVRDRSDLIKRDAKALAPISGLTQPQDEVFGWWFSGQSTADTLSWLKQNNGSWLDKSGTKAALLQPESLQAFEWMADLINRYGISPKPRDAPLQDNDRGGRHWFYLRGKTAMFNLLLGQESAWSRDTLDQSAGLVKVGVAVLPKGMRRAAGSTSHLWYIRGDTPNLEPSWEFVKWWYNDLETQVGCWTVWRYGLPAARKAWSDPRVLQPRADRPLDVRPFIEPWDKGYAARHEANPVWTDWFNAFNAPFTAALNGDQPVRIAMEQAQRDVQAVLDQKLPHK